MRIGSSLVIMHYHFSDMIGNIFHYFFFSIDATVYEIRKPIKLGAATR